MSSVRDEGGGGAPGGAVTGRRGETMGEAGGQAEAGCVLADAREKGGGPAAGSEGGFRARVFDRF